MRVKDFGILKLQAAPDSIQVLAQLWISQLKDKPNLDDKTASTAMFLSQV